MEQSKSNQLVIKEPSKIYIATKLSLLNKRNNKKREGWAKKYRITDFLRGNFTVESRATRK